MLTDEQKNLRDEAVTEALKEIKKSIISSQKESGYESHLLRLVEAVHTLNDLN